ncbi:ChaN family lipoprotein [Pseudomonas viridiflava]|uniref:ChaN family lipoprotein n=1 Tax=Pseudomonas viridiflava TaxID=33069 RepID=UPI0020C03D7F|nr:ChaN family lipoprotein [Pseudomonas viridiflava]
MIRDTQSGLVLTSRQLAERLAAAPRVLVGEQHDNPDHHAVQLWLLQVLADQRAQGSVLLEALSPNQQASVDSVREQITQSDGPVDLLAALQWQPGWDWTLHGPVMRFALAQPYPLLSANLDLGEVKSIYQRVPALLGPRSTAPEVQTLLMGHLRASHEGLLPVDQEAATLAVQQQRDRRLAQSLLDAPTPAILIAGFWHARKDAGAPLHMADLDTGAAPLVLLLAQIGDEIAEGSADYVWYTVARPRQDPGIQ